jgi:hypothetical protein
MKKKDSTKRVFTAKHLDAFEVIIILIFGVLIALTIWIPWGLSGLGYGASVLFTIIAVGIIALSSFMITWKTEVERSIIGGVALGVLGIFLLITLLAGITPPSFVDVIVYQIIGWILIGALLVVTTWATYKRASIATYPPSHAIRYHIYIAFTSVRMLGLILFLVGIAGNIFMLLYSGSFIWTFLLFVVLAGSSLLAIYYSEGWQRYIVLIIEAAWIVFWFTIVLFNALTIPLLNLPLLLDPLAYWSTIGVMITWIIGITFVLWLRQSKGAKAVKLYILLDKKA